MPPCLIFEDEDLLVINKPAGLNTHAPSPFAGDGVYEWLRHREPRWSGLAILHRLDKETSGLMVFGKSTRANRSLTSQFTAGAVRKKYHLLTDRPVRSGDIKTVSILARVGERYVSRPAGSAGERAETHFHVIGSDGKLKLLEARPLTGRTHQIRAQAAALGFPILGDALYGGTTAPRVCLHSVELAFDHPATGQRLEFTAPPAFNTDSRQALRAALINPEETNAHRLVHGAADGWPGWHIDRLGSFLLSQSESAPDETQRVKLSGLMADCGASGTYHKIQDRRVRGANAAEASPRFLMGTPASGPFAIRENNLQFEINFNEGYSAGLFLDQRDNRRRFLTAHVAAQFPLFTGGFSGASILNTFAYTCGFSVCAARAGARVTSLDLSKKYLEWGRRNFALNGLDAAGHEFIYGDVFDWLRRIRRRGKLFDAIILDPPTFSSSKEHGVFRAEKDFHALAEAALPLLKPDGILFSSTNAARLGPEQFLEQLESAARRVGRRVVQQYYSPQPPDFPITRAEPAYLKTVWMRFAQVRTAILDNKNGQKRHTIVTESLDTPRGVD